MFCTKFRHMVENTFARTWRERFFERGAGVHYSLLKPYDKLPAPDSPKLQIALENSMALQVCYIIREYPSRKYLCSFGHCPNSHWAPPPRTQTGTLWHLFSGKIMQMPVCTWTFLLKIGATNHPGKGLDPPTQTGNAQMNRDFLMLGLP